jgi:hypothetical protein
MAAFKQPALWFNAVEDLGLSSFHTVSRSVQNRYLEILNFFTNRSTNAAESFNAKVKAFGSIFRACGKLNSFYTDWPNSVLDLWHSPPHYVSLIHHHDRFCSVLRPVLFAYSEPVNPKAQAENRTIYRIGYCYQARCRSGFSFTPGLTCPVFADRLLFSSNSLCLPDADRSYSLHKAEIYLIPTDAADCRHRHHRSER